jgi:hypothetical protein
VPQPVPFAFADDDNNDKKECKKNEGGNNCNDTKKSVSPELECEHQIKDNEGSVIDSKCTNNSQILIDSNINELPSDGGGNGDFDSPTVVSVDPNDGQNNVALNTEIKVVFSETMDQGTLDDDSLDIFNLDGSVDPNVNANPSDKSVTYTLDSQLEPGTRYEAQLDFDIQDINGNFLDCSDSNDVDSSCSWQFETTGTSVSPDIILSPTSGPVLTSVDVTGSGFAPQSGVTITFDGLTVAAATTDSNGDFSAIFNVPLSSSIGEHTVKAIERSNTASETFEVTSLLGPVIALDPTSGPVGTTVDIVGSGFDPSTVVTLKFDGTTVTTTPNTITTSSSGGFSANFTIPASSEGSKTVVASQGSKSASKPFTVTDTTPAGPSITLNPTSGPVDTPVTVSGTGFEPSSIVSITFDDISVTTVPAIVTTNPQGEFSGITFVVPDSPNGPQDVEAVQGTNSASKSFTVTSGTVSSAVTEGIGSLPF